MARPDAFVAHVVRANKSASYRARIAAVASFLCLLIAAVSFTRREGSATELGMGSDENAKFPAGYNFGNNNVLVFGKNDEFGAGDTFGNDNVFGKGDTFRAGSQFQDRNFFGSHVKFGPGSSLGDKETIGGYSQFGDGDQIDIGNRNEFGPHSEFGRRTAFGHENQYGAHTTFGAYSSFGKHEQFGDDTVWAPKHQTLQGKDMFGHDNWGLNEDELPKSDKETWKAVNDPDFIPENDKVAKAISLRSAQGSDAQDKKYAQLQLVHLD
ncbi:hypothetical protein GUITHDRAFT_140887 [Guillardia theta CCMP2712]|uniref:Uncharacterized protein n=1 Tax=Guillardia theta (strain CCMP2712) TaxID=905079 RepID=L1J4M2_GUITC|nr:hypothetical protein GUITHDRAFT_140887 [Guillardia theta CCMP2712]EKX43040.1 hypothetical protein GUITHDRAFT_140887 [Guillardia theta CCMP2712]|eukprot:XP_005830020.1 hypothetical protein GUITHDRAFT_140887 [Guillardia theta CCMP2712]